MALRRAHRCVDGRSSAATRPSGAAGRLAGRYARARTQKRSHTRAHEHASEHTQTHTNTRRHTHTRARALDRQNNGNGLSRAGPAGQSRDVSLQRERGGSGRRRRILQRRGWGGLREDACPPAGPFALIRRPGAPARSASRLFPASLRAAPFPPPPPAGRKRARRCGSWAGICSRFGKSAQGVGRGLGSPSSNRRTAGLGPEPA